MINLDCLRKQFVEPFSAGLAESALTFPRELNSINFMDSIAFSPSTWEIDMGYLSV